MIKATTNSPKIFGIGLNKTGTSTLGACFKHLGYKSTSHSRRLLIDIVENDYFASIEETVSQYDAFEDWPWPLIYRQLDECFPGSKFILTTRRNSEVWLKSLEKHSMRTDPFTHSRKLVYGFNYPHFHQKEHLLFYENHNEKVRRYFADRTEDFIELCWEKGSGWEELCSFLDKPVPPTPFPHVNKNKRPKRMRLYLNLLRLHLRF